MLNFEVNANNEFFLALGQAGIHSFIMLGVIRDDGSPQLIARVGKTNDIDSATPNEFMLAIKNIGQGTLSRLKDEGLFRNPGHQREINYQAYTINLQQVQEFLQLFYTLEKAQLTNEKIKTAVEHNRICCYIPSIKDDKVTFTYQNLAEAFKGDTTTPSVLATSMSQRVQRITANDNCRTTALDIMEGILKVRTTISRYFFIGPPYQTTLYDGRHPDQQNFYILPLPPKAYPNKTQSQNNVLEKLYARLEQIPKFNPKDPKTRDKFNALKQLYKEIAGENNLNAEKLLTLITTNESRYKHQLYTRRSSNFFSRFFQVPTTTQVMIENIKSSLINK
jgi:hypothetical protein